MTFKCPKCGRESYHTGLCDVCHYRMVMANYRAEQREFWLGILVAVGAGALAVLAYYIL